MVFISEPFNLIGEFTKLLYLLITFWTVSSEAYSRQSGLRYMTIFVPRSTSSVSDIS